jgi:hypothetical protein
MHTSYYDLLRPYAPHPTAPLFPFIAGERPLTITPPQSLAKDY